MKKLLKCVAGLMTVLGNLCIFIGSFVTFAKEYNWYYGGRNPDALFLVFEYEGYEMEKAALAIMWIAVYVSLFIYTIDSIKDIEGMWGSLILVLIAFVGKYCFGLIKKEMYPWVYEEVMVLEDNIGYTMIEKAYTVIIVAAVLLLAIRIYSRYIEKNLKEKWQAMIVPMGSTRCPSCRKIISKDSKFCGICGFSFESLRCLKCGARREAKEKFCRECGAQLPVIETKEDGESFPRGWD